MRRLWLLWVLVIPLIVLSGCEILQISGIPQSSLKETNVLKQLDNPKNDNPKEILYQSWLTNTIRKAKKIVLQQDDIEIENLGILDMKAMFTIFWLDKVFTRTVPDDAQCMFSCKIYHHDWFNKQVKECKNFWIKLPKYNLKLWTTNRLPESVDTKKIIKNGILYFNNKKGIEIYSMPTQQTLLKTLQHTWATRKLDSWEEVKTCFQKLSANLYKKNTIDNTWNILQQSWKNILEWDSTNIKFFTGEVVSWHQWLGEKLNTQENLQIYEWWFMLWWRCNITDIYFQTKDDIFIKVSRNIQVSDWWPLCPLNLVDSIK